MFLTVIAMSRRINSGLRVLAFPSTGCRVTGGFTGWGLGSRRNLLQ